MAKADLSGVGVLVTRPKEQSTKLATAIESRGGTSIQFPVMEIIPREHDAINASINSQDPADIVIFVSPNAVRYGAEFVATEKLAAIGPATAAALEAAGQNVDILSADGYDSEHLLATSALHDVADKRIRIVRGNRGRELLASTLRHRGAGVDYLEVYERRVPEYEESQLDELEQRWQSDGIDIVTVMSAEAFRNLTDILPASCVQALATTPLVTPAKRVIKEAEERFPGIPTTLASGPQARYMLDAILACNNTLSGHSE